MPRAHSHTKSGATSLSAASGKQAGLRRQSGKGRGFLRVWGTLSDGPEAAREENPPNEGKRRAQLAGLDH